MSPTLIWIAIAILAVIIVVAIAYAMQRQQRTRAIREKFGPEYEETVKAAGGNRSRAEQELLTRAERVRHYDIRPLTAAERDRFSQDWRGIQSLFVDRPEEAVRKADDMIGQVMAARGYPVGDFEQRTSDVSVGHGDVVGDYRIAHGLTIANETGERRTEDLRQAMVHYRKLFEELVSERSGEVVREEERRGQA